MNPHAHDELNMICTVVFSSLEVRFTKQGKLALTPQSHKSTHERGKLCVSTGNAQINNTNLLEQRTLMKGRKQTDPMIIEKTFFLILIIFLWLNMRVRNRSIATTSI